MSDLLHKEKHKGFKIKIYRDDELQSPDHWQDDQVFLVFDHSQFSIQRRGFEPEDIVQHWAKNPNGLYDGYYMIPIEAYIHSGVSLAIRNQGNFPDRRWDVSFKGFILVKRRKGAWIRKQAVCQAETLLTDWNNYLEAEGAGYEIPKLDDSCWGFYSWEKALDAAREHIDHVVAQRCEPIPEL